jgi:glucose/arabinose dehydrogenase
MSSCTLLFRAAAAALLVLGLSSQKLTADESPARHVFPSLNGNFVAERVLSDLSQPAAIQFLPDGRALVAQRDRGVLTLADVSSGETADIQGLPRLVVHGDAGIHDIELHPDYARNGWVYISYTDGEKVHATAVLDRFRLEGSRATDVERLFTADAYSEAAYHLAARIAFVDDYVYLALGDREHPEKAQDNSNHAGTVVRLRDDGSVPEDNPLVGVEEQGKPRPLPEIWSYGHRDPMGLYRHPKTGDLWLHEHGPRGGDEVQVVRKGANYGWPIVSYGLQYDGGPVGMGIPWQEGMEIPAWVYVPSIAPSDLVIYEGAAFPAWQGNFLIGAMAGMHLNRLVFRDGEVVAEERLAQRLLGRIRSIGIDAQGLIYLGTDNGEVWRLRPE